MNIRSKFNKKSSAIALILIIILVSLLAVFLIKKNDSPQSDNQSSNGAPGSNAPAAVDEPKPEGLQDPEAISLDTELPEGTLSPHTVASDPNQYFGKELKVRGLVVESSSGTYSITGQKPEEELGLRLDFSKVSTVTKQYSTPVTIIGSLKTPDGKNPLTLEVESIQQ